MTVKDANNAWAARDACSLVPKAGEMSARLLAKGRWRQIPSSPLVCVLARGIYEPAMVLQALGALKDAIHADYPQAGGDGTKPARTRAAREETMNIQGSEFPEDLYYDPDHYWLRREADGTVTMGMNDFAQKLAGEIVFVQLPKEGKAVKKGKKLAKVESGKWLGKIMGPLDGVIKEVNLDLENQPTLINQDCYGKGWMYRITPDDPAQLEDLIHGAAIEQWAKDEAAKHQS